jgi:hypothetical protein
MRSSSGSGTPTMATVACLLSPSIVVVVESVVTLTVQVDVVLEDGCAGENHVGLVVSTPAATPLGATSLPRSAGLVLPPSPRL